jgi:hypothetical protein
MQAAHPYRVLDRLRTTGGEQHMPEAFRGDLDDRPRRFAANVRGIGRGEGTQPVGLLLDGRDDAWVLVTEVGEDQL